MSAIPRLRPAAEVFKGNTQCSSDECLVTEFTNSQMSRWVLDRIARTDSEELYSLFYWLGLRYGRLFVSAEIQSGKVVRYGYQVQILNGSNIPGAVFVSAALVPSFQDRGLEASIDESPDFRVQHYFKWPELDTRVEFTKAVAPQLRSYAFHLHLNCIWTLRGCKVARQIAPELDKEKKKIDSRTQERLEGDNQCPESILPHRARDFTNIILVQVTSVGPLNTRKWGTPYQPIEVQRVNVLKGKAEFQSKPLEVATTLQWNSNHDIPNSALQFLKHGQRLLLFSDRSWVDFPCELMQATPTAVAMLEDSLQASRLRPSSRPLLR